MIESRQFGRSGLSAPPIMLGANVFGWTADRAASYAVLDAYAGGGGRLIDSADVYSAWVPGNKGGESETIIGEWLRRSGRRADVLIATKVGLLAGAGGTGLQPARIAAAIDESLARLGTDVIDIYFAHRDDPSVPLADVIGAFDALVRAGKVRAIGASNYSAPRLAEALAISDANGLARFSVVEPHYNLLFRDEYEGALQDLVVAEGLACVPYFSLANGYLTGKYRSDADLTVGTRGSRVRDFHEGKGPAMLAALDTVAAETGAGLPEIALAWLAAQPGIAAPIASASSVAQVGPLLASATLALSADHLALLDRAGR